MCPVAATDVNLGLGIHGLALFGEPGEGRGPVALPKKRAGVPASRPFGQHIHRSVEPDGDGALVQQLARPGIDKGAAACRDHSDGAIDQTRNEAPLPVTEIMFAILFEQFGRGRPGSLFDFDIAVDEGKSQPLGQATADGRLAGPHEANEHDRPVKHVGQLLHFVAVSLWAGLYIVAQGRAKAFLQPPRVFGVAMPRGLIFLVVILLLLVGGIYFLSRSAEEVPTQTIEADVTANAAAN